MHLNILILLYTGKSRKILKCLCILFIIQFLANAAVFGQPGDSRTDSIKRVLPSSSGKEKADLLIRLSRIYREMDTDSCLKYANRANLLSTDLDYSLGIAHSLLQLGIAHHDLSKVVQGREYYLQALKIYEETGDIKGQANALNGLGNSYMGQSDNKTAIKHHASALLLRAQIGDKQGLANSYNNIGNAYAAEANYYLALNNHLKGLAMKEELNDTSESGKDRLAMGYFNTGRLYLAIEDHKRAEELFSKAEKLYEQINNRGGLALVYAARGGIAHNLQDYEKSIRLYSKAIETQKQYGAENGNPDDYIRLGSSYYYHALKTDSAGQKSKENKNLDIAFNYINIGIDLSKKLNYEMGLASAYVLLGNVYQRWGDYENSQASFDKAMKLRLIPSNKIALYRGLYLLKQDQKDYKGALENYTLYMNMKDSVYNTQTTLKNAQLGNAYEEEKKEKVRELTDKMKELEHEEEIKRQRMIQLFTLIGLFLVVIFAAFVYRSNRQKQKANIIITKQKSEVENAYKIIEEQKKIVDEHNKDITDSINYARRIQTALLASDNLLLKNLPEFFVLYKPKDIVSGDFYWASEIADGATKKFILCAGDCTGHGVPGAFMSLLNISKLNETINEKRIVKPDLVLNTVRDEIIKALNPENAEEECNDGMDCTVCSLELYKNTNHEGKNSGRLSYAAANNPFYLIREGQLIVGKADKIPVGKSLREKEPFSFHSVDLQKGDTLYLLTDGYADQFGGAAGKKFKYKQLEQLLLSSCPETMAEQKKILNQTIENWKGTNEQVDDILLIGIRV